MREASLAALFTHARIREALDAARAWTAAEPHTVTGWQYRGNAELWLGQPEAAERSYREALRRAPALSRNRANLAIALLAQGRYREAWPLYESRYAADLSAHDQVRFPFAPARQWHGEALAGRRLLLVREQGFGDQIQFIRLAHQLHARGTGQVSLLSAPALARLMHGVAGVDAVLTEPPAETDFDLWSPLLSLPLLLGIEAPQPAAEEPYLHAPPDRVDHWRREIGTWAQGRKRFGLVWAGSPGNSVDKRRSLSLTEVFSLLEARGNSLPISLQLGAAGMEELAAQCQRGLVPLMDMLSDFAETAAVIANLDLVITVDTAVAHLAGALGKPTWLLLPVGADWRWAQQGESTPWYPTMRLFRQHVAGDWTQALAQLAGALSHWAQT